MESRVIELVSKALGVPVALFARVEGSSNDLYIVKVDSSFIVAKVLNSETTNGAQFEIDILSRLTSAVDGVSILEALVETPLQIEDRPLLLYRAFSGETVTTGQIDIAFLTRLAKAQRYMHESLENVSSCPRKRFLPEDLSFVKEFGCHFDPLVRNTLPLLENMRLGIDFSIMPKTIIHDDMSMGNILVNGDQVHIVDFSDAHHSFRISDIANTIKELVVDNFGLAEELINVYLKGYSNSAKMPLTHDEQNALPYLLLRRALFMYCYYISRGSGAYVHRDNIDTQRSTVGLLMKEYEL